jgi:hypothetical protein
MITYKDRTFCNAGVLCKNSYTCQSVLQPSDIVEARKLGLPICQMDFTQAPCFVPFFTVGVAPKATKSCTESARQYAKRIPKGQKRTKSQRVGMFKGVVDV